MSSPPSNHTADANAKNESKSYVMSEVNIPNLNLKDRISMTDNTPP